MPEKQGILHRNDNKYADFSWNEHKIIVSYCQGKCYREMVPDSPYNNFSICSEIEFLTPAKLFS